MSLLARKSAARDAFMFSADQTGWLEIGKGDNAARTLPSQHDKVADAVPHCRAEENVRGEVRLVRQPGQRQETGGPVSYPRYPPMFSISG